MTCEARVMSGIILITVPTIQYGAYFLLTSLMNKNSGYMENPLRQNFFSRWARTCRRYRDSLAHLSDARGCGSATHTPPLVCPNRNTAVRNSNFGGIFLFGATTDCHSSQWNRFADLFRSSHSCNWSYCTWHWIAAISTNCVDRHQAQSNAMRLAAFPISSNFVRP